jgi:hypothetical protein
MRLTDAELVEIGAGCEGVTPGPWHVVAGGDDWNSGVDASISGKAVVWASDRSTEPDTGIDNPLDADHIARLSPERVSALATELLELRAALAPFANILDDMLNPRVPDHTPAVWEDDRWKWSPDAGNYPCTVGDLRRARKALGTP